jgi:hypothetical protein
MDEETPNPEPSNPTPPPAGKSKLTRYERREVAAADALRTLIRDLYLDQFRKPADQAQEFSLKLNIKVDPADNWKLVFDPKLPEQVRRTVGDVEAEWGMFQAGRIFDFHAGSARSDKSVPPSATMVFSGYDSFGAPQWCEFSQLLIDTKDPRVDQLYEPRAPALSVVLYGKQLKGEQLSSYGKASKTYSILGQVAFGFIMVPVARQRMKAHGEKLALTFQFVETRDEQGQFDLRVNTVAGIYTLEEIEELLLVERNSWIYRAREVAIRELEKVRGRALRAKEAGNQDAYNEAMRAMSGLLRSFSSSLERGNRQSKRRTQHAEKRKTNAARPTHKALDDVKVANPDMFYKDTRHDSIVVLGKPNRVHAFSNDGKHITSFTIKPDAVDHRTRKERWVAMAGEEARAMKQTIESLIPQNSGKSD